MPKIERVFTLTNLNVNCKHVLLNLIKEGKDVFIELPGLCFLNRVSERNSHHCSNIKLYSGFQAYLAQ